MRSIQTKLTVAILTIFLISLSALGGLNYWKARNIIGDSIIAEVAKQTEGTAGDIGDWLEARKAELTLAAVSPEIRNGNKEAIFAFLKAATEARSEYESISYSDSSGDTLTAQGVRVNSADREYFQRAMQGETFVSDPNLSRVTNNPVLFISTPVKTNGKITGALIGVIKFEGLSKKVLSVKVGQTGFAYVVQQNGLIIIHPDKAAAMKTNPLTDANTDPGRKAMVERMIKGETGSSVMVTNGVERYLAYAPVPGGKWSIGVAVPSSEVSGAVSSLTTISIITIVTVLLIAAVLITWYARRIARPIQTLEEAAKRIAAGDITQIQLSIVSNDEIGRLGKSFEKMAENLRRLIRQITQTTEQVAASSEELTASAEQSALASNQVAQSITEVAGGAAKQMKAVENTAVVVDQMSGAIQQIAANINAAADTSTNSAGAAQGGSQAVDKAVTQMSNIEKTVTKSAQVVAKLGERSKEIGQIVDAISGIAGQTNLLALNAAIEAARAGEQGRGFAVVAEEVRKLAEQSQEAAKQISQLIAEIQSDTDSAVTAMDEGTKEVRIGAEVVNNAGMAFQAIYRSINDISAQIREISTAVRQMADGSQQVVSTVQEIDRISKETASQSQSVSAATEEQSATMQEIAASSQALAKMAEELTQAVRMFKI